MWRWLPLTAILEEHPARIMFWESEPLPAVSQRLAGLGVESRVYAPCANRPDDGDWLSVMDANRHAVELLPNR